MGENENTEYLYLNTCNHFDITNYKSKIIIGNLEIANIKHFNKLNKLMFKYLFGVKIEDIEEKNK